MLAKPQAPLEVINRVGHSPLAIPREASFWPRFQAVVMEHARPELLLAAYGSGATLFYAELLDPEALAAVTPALRAARGMVMVRSRAAVPGWPTAQLDVTLTVASRRRLKRELVSVSPAAWERRQRERSA